MWQEYRGGLAKVRVVQPAVECSKFRDLCSSVFSVQVIKRSMHCVSEPGDKPGQGVRGGGVLGQALQLGLGVKRENYM